MNFIILILKTWIMPLILFSAKSVSSKEEDPDWVKANDVVYYGPKFINEGERFEISCRMSEFNAPKWTKNETPIISSDRISFRNREGIQQTRIEILSVKQAIYDDSGFYRCNSFSRASHRLDVIPLQENKFRKDFSPQPEVAFEEIKEENSEIVLDCSSISDSKTELEFFWQKDGKLISNNDKRRKIVGSKLIIENATSAVDAGDYMCRIDAMVASGGAQFGQIIQLRAPIRVSPFPKTQSVVFGKTHVLECNYTGFPFGKIRWLIGNRMMSWPELQSLGIEIRPNNSTHPDAVLIIKKLDFSHQNSYTCKVGNKFSEDETSVFITVRENAIQTNGPKLLLNENKYLNIFCNLTEDVNNWQVARKFEWFKDGVEYNKLPEEDRERIAINPEDFSLVINKANKNDIGNYMCRTGDGRLNATIKVRTKPWLYLFEEYQKTNYKSANIIEGEKFYLKCELISDYARDATIKWFKYNESEHEDEHKYLMPLLEGDPDIKIERENDTKITLTIDKVKPSDRFYYVCKANNSVSTFNNTILLRVKDKLGALWPFLGIVGEVVILCSIIFIYEKRRVKPDFDESDNDNNTEMKATQDRSTKPQDVRQRK